LGEGTAVSIVRFCLVQLGLAAAAGNLLAIGTLLVGAQDRAAALAVVLLLVALFPWSLAVALQSVPEVLAACGTLIESLTLTLFWIPPTALHVACYWTHHTDCHLSRRLLVAAYALGAAGFAGQASGLVSLGGLVDHGWGVMHSGGAVLFALQGMLLLVCLGIAVYWCGVRLRSEVSREQKLGARVWLVSAAVLSAAALSNYLAIFGFPVIAAGAVGNVLFLVVLAGFAMRHGFLRLQPLVGRTAAALALGVGCVWVVATGWCALTSPPGLGAWWVALELASAGAASAAILCYGWLRPRESRAVALGLESSFFRMETPNLQWSNLRLAPGAGAVSQSVAERLSWLPHIATVAIYRRRAGAKLFQLEAATAAADQRLPHYATHTQLQALTAGPAEPGLPHGHGARRGQLRAWPVPRFGSSEGYLVVEDTHLEHCGAEALFLESVALVLDYQQLSRLKGNMTTR
jgi:hypothetical protein